MDGVLIDSHPVHRQAWRKFLESVGKNVPDEQLDFILEGRRREDILRHFLGDLPASTLVEYGQRKDYFFHENFKEVKPIPGILSFLDMLDAASIARGIATSASSFRTWKTLQLLKWEKKFATVVTGDDVSSGKPDPAMYRLASERMNLLPKHLLALEDAPCGVEAAKSAGILCIGVSSNGRVDALRQAGADFIIPDFVDLGIDKLIQLWATINPANTDGVRLTRSNI
jgi:HAD superfamily hydrolase (TIGR01509 family)